MNYDLIIIGFGKAGKTLALKVANLGKKVALIEKSSLMYGGTCINVGCIPTKFPVNSAKNAKFIGDRDKYFFESIAKKDALVSALCSKNLAMLENHVNIDIINGFASFSGENSVLIDGANEISAKIIAINTGSKPAVPHFKVNSQLLYTSEGILSLRALPRDLVVIGGGYIGLEFASMFANFGSKVKIISRSELFKNEDEDVKEALISNLYAQGIEILSGCDIRNLDGRVLSFEQNGVSASVEADAFLLSTGRIAASEGLNLDIAGVKSNSKGEIIVNEFLQTSNPNIFALGDVKGGELFTYISLDDFRIAFDKIFGRGFRSTKNRIIHASVLFLDTPYAKIGISEREAIKSGREVKILKLAMSAVPGAKVILHDTGFLKAIVDAKSGEILGAEFCCAYAGELINEIALAMNFGAKADFFKNQIFTHPSLSEALNDLFGQF